MSDPMTNVEIEDVLSSIRRLVSEQPMAPERAKHGKLVLTPAFRVETVQEEAAPVIAEVQAEVQAEEAVTAPPPEVLAPEPVEAPAPDDDLSLEDRITELEHAVAASAGDWEPDGSEEDAGVVPQDFSPTFGRAEDGTHAWTKPVWEAPRSQTPTPEQDNEEDGEGVFDDDTSEETVLDEEMLRDLVAEFVRQELQGALGERITRNVRKLVRAEIQRALAAHDFG